MFDQAGWYRYQRHLVVLDASLGDPVACYKSEIRATPTVSKLCHVPSTSRTQVMHDLAVYLPLIMICRGKQPLTVLDFPLSDSLVVALLPILFNFIDPIRISLMWFVSIKLRQMEANWKRETIFASAAKWVSHATQGVELTEVATVLLTVVHLRKRGICYFLGSARR